MCLYSIDFTCLHVCRFFEEQSLEYLQISKTQILGICTGLLAASAVASCNSLTSLVPLAVQTIIVAFRLGLRVASTGAQIESRAESDQEWSTIVVGIGSDAAEAALADFNEAQVSIWISSLHLADISRDWHLRTNSTSVPLERQQ